MHSIFEDSIKEFEQDDSPDAEPPFNIFFLKAILTEIIPLRFQSRPHPKIDLLISEISKGISLELESRNLEAIAQMSSIAEIFVDWRYPQEKLASVMLDVNSDRKNPTFYPPVPILEFLAISKVDVSEIFSQIATLTLKKSQPFLIYRISLLKN